MIIHAYGGLANRLRVILSYGSAGYRYFRWDRDGEIAHARFDDVFVPLYGINFVDAGVHTLRTCDPLQSAPPDWNQSYRLLRLRNWRLFHTTRPIEPYGAIHVRRTDHVGYARELRNETPDTEFLSWLSTAPLRIYLATDNGDTQLEYMKAIRESGRDCFVYNNIIRHDNQDDGGVRNTSLTHAAVDLFICAGATSFKGTRESSFSDAITMLKELGGWWS